MDDFDGLFGFIGNVFGAIFRMLGGVVGGMMDYDGATGSGRRSPRSPATPSVPNPVDHHEP